MGERRRQEQTQGLGPESPERIAKSSVFRCEESMRPSNRDMEWALRSGVERRSPGWRYKFGSHHMFEDPNLC